MNYEAMLAAVVGAVMHRAATTKPWGKGTRETLWLRCARLFGDVRDVAGLVHDTCNEAAGAAMTLSREYRDMARASERPACEVVPLRPEGAAENELEKPILVLCPTCNEDGEGPRYNACGRCAGMGRVSRDARAQLVPCACNAGRRSISPTNCLQCVRRGWVAPPPATAS